MGLEDILGQVLEQAGGDASGAQSGDGGGGLNDLLSQLGGRSQAGGAAGAAGMAGVIGALAPMVAGFLEDGGLEKLLSGFRGAGLGKQAQSWIGTGPNESISGSQVDQALSHEQIAGMAAKLGLTPEQTSDLLAGVIPGVVDKVTPDGQVPTTEELAAQLGG